MLLLTACKSNVEAKLGWLRGSLDERSAQIEKHLRGLDVAMVETGYRYGELFWAGSDQNWKFAGYQLGKIKLAVENGVERRPKRAESAKMLSASLDTVRLAIESQDKVAFAVAFEGLTATCNACHKIEGVDFMPVAPPTHRASPVRMAEAKE